MSEVPMHLCLRLFSLTNLVGSGPFHPKINGFAPHTQHGHLRIDWVLMMYAKRHLPAVEQWSQSSGSNVIPRRARPGLAGLRPHIREPTAPWRQPRGKIVVSLVNSHTNATRMGWHLWVINLIFVPWSPPGWRLQQSYRGTSPVKNSPPPQDPPRTPGIGLQ